MVYFVMNLLFYQRLTSGKVPDFKDFSWIALLKYAINAIKGMLERPLNY